MVKYAWMEGPRTDYTLDEMCTVLALSARLTDAQMLTWIRAIHEELNDASGSPRMVKEL